MVQIDFQVTFFKPVGFLLSVVLDYDNQYETKKNKNQTELEKFQPKLTMLDLCEYINDPKQTNNTVQLLCFTHMEDTFRRRVQNQRLSSMIITTACDENGN